MRKFKYPVTALLLSINVGVFFYQSSLGPNSILLTAHFAAIPLRITTALHWLGMEKMTSYALEPLATLFTAIFLHADSGHLANNMIFLWIFASLLEITIGKTLLLFLFPFAGAAGNLLQVLWHPSSRGPILGASGAVSGLEATYLVLALRTELPWPQVWPLSRAIPPMQLGMAAIFGFLFDLYSLTDSRSHVAYGAHIGGFITGAFFGMLLTTFKKDWVGPK